MRERLIGNRVSSDSEWPYYVGFWNGRGLEIWGAGGGKCHPAGALLGRVFFESDSGEREFKMAENGVSLVKINLRLMKTL
jgi:hypothetical protein